jgi:5-methyltetrahydrofolate--homocysteine methyltransferase
MTDMEKLEETLSAIAEGVIAGKAPLVKDLVQSCLDGGIDPGVVLQRGLVAGMEVVGRRFKADEMYMPEVMIAARAMNAGLAVLDPVLGESNVALRGKIVVGTVRGDLHDVGKNMVSMMFRGSGFQVEDLGIDVAEDRFTKAVKEQKPDILGLSALLSTTVPALKSTIDAIEEAGLRDKVVIMVGGAPVTQSFADEIGADGYAPDAASAVERALELMAASKKT